MSDWVSVLWLVGDLAAVVYFIVGVFQAVWGLLESVGADDMVDGDE